MCLHHIPFPRRGGGKEEEGVLSPLVSDMRQPEVDLTNAIYIKTFFQAICTIFLLYQNVFYFIKISKS